MSSSVLLINKLQNIIHTAVKHSADSFNAVKRDVFSAFDMCHNIAGETGLLDEFRIAHLPVDQ